MAFTLSRRFFACLTISAALTASNAFADVTGAGSSFVYPLMSKWSDMYKDTTKVNYQSIGSSGGISQIKAKTVTFGASDKPLKPAELKASGLVQFPVVIGGVVPVINMPGLKTNQLKLTGPVLADIFMGKIKRWNDPAIMALNAGVKLPAAPITVVHRSDGSGTTFLFTNYLAKVSPAWKSKVGNDASVAWPTGMGGKGNEGVAAFVQKVKGSIGYVEYSYAKQTKMPTAQLKNASGSFVSPDDLTFKAAAAGAKWSPANSFYEILTEQSGAQAWPITGAVFVLMQQNAVKPADSAAALKFFEYGLSKGDAAATALDYVPLPDAVVKMVKDSWSSIK